MSTTVSCKVTWAEDAPAWLRYWFPLVRFIKEYPAGHSVNEMEDIQNLFARTHLEDRSMSFFHGFSRWSVGFGRIGAFGKVQTTTTRYCGMRRGGTG